MGKNGLAHGIMYPANWRGGVKVIWENMTSENSQQICSSLVQNWWAMTASGAMTTRVRRDGLHQLLLGMCYWSKSLLHLANPGCIPASDSVLRVSTPQLRRKRGSRRSPVFSYDTYALIETVTQKKKEISCLHRHNKSSSPSWPLHSLISRSLLSYRPCNQIQEYQS